MLSSQSAVIRRGGFPTLFSIAVTSRQDDVHMCLYYKNFISMRCLWFYLRGGSGFLIKVSSPLYFEYNMIHDLIVNNTKNNIFISDYNDH